MPTAEIEITPDEIQQQLARLLASHHFCHSNRYPALLKYLVEHTQSDRGVQLKERLLGIEVFHRAPDYDTNNDPVVRVTAAEIRKRIAQYYQEPEHTGEIRIEIPTGSYAPRFFRVPAHSAPAPPAGLREAPASLPAAFERKMGAAPALGNSGAVEKNGQTSRWLPLILAFCMGGLLAFGVWRSITGFEARREHAVRDFWAPLANSDRPVLVVMGDHTIGSQGNALRASQGAAVSPSEDVLQLMNEHEQVTVGDAISLFKITEYMVRHTQSYNAEGAGGSTLEDLRNGPVLLFAGLDNRWTMRLAEHLPFRFVDSPNDAIGTIEDSLNPGRQWQVDFHVPYSKLPMDYAVVARYFDPLIEQPVIVAAGIGATGTASASEFVTSEREMEDLEKIAPKGWQHQNLEVVLETRVIDGHPGPPHIVASHFW